ncbi:ribosome hibernation-promoting factor, HPF/YfiA family [Jiangella rhizosphaerae]|uniref:Ribosome hibernation promoting factor n=1 Tax=Jiangella rhizosphaerae TaxID=2293569 RepID=A0A418KQT9_9ACTN|nr:ribosome-associated translation inhibitor RaiA [Jiangella rhizosphaerae]RIQ23082.1 ribosome-associated translation inhibitor RaiA [Jiangella rhizosphaerae]
MDIVIKGRHTTVPERFRSHVAEKLSKLDKIAHKVIRVDVEVTAEANPRQNDQSERVELTLHSKGPVIRAEAAAADRYAALDLATDKLVARLRKAADRRRVHRGTRTPISVAAATARLDGAAIPAQPTPVAPAAPAATAVEEPLDDYAVPDAGPMVVREKTHRAEPMTLDQALYEMELVGHDFYLYVDADSKMPSVVYRRRGYDYGVIRLDV